MAYSARIVETSNRAGAITAAGNAGTYLTDAVALAQNRRIVADVIVPTCSGGATVDFQLKWAATSGGSYTAITGTAITQDTVGGLWHTVETTTEYIKNANPTAAFVKGSLVVGTAANNATAIIRTYDIRYMPTTDSAASAGQVIKTTP